MQTTTKPTPRTAAAGTQGFTLIELLVVLAIVATLLSLVAPHYLGSVDRAKEVVLKENLATLRATLDHYHADTGRYPDSLQELVERRYLRAVPEDPVTQSTTTWVIVGPPPGVRGAKGAQGAVFDIRSGAQGAGRDGKAFVDW